ncbi:hypothetical protein J7I44_01740 [Frateuria sp. MAH-13]|uniref:Uncharacterized protein n=1 Tax=Frateuria flava TaxID=2821489 RepID=A0ABS4DIX9_9GAMM|nr:hypothetical protein [Frateuria flava]MBP1473001.1 hypothetical protein [Frateuria flava]
MSGNSNVSETSTESAQLSYEKSGWLTRKLAGFYASRDAVKKHPLWGTLFFLLCACGGVAASEAYGYVRSKIVGPDEFLVQMRNEQKLQFAELRQNLGKLSGDLDGEGRRALESVKGAVKSLESANTTLMDQLAMAKQENESMRKLAEAKSGLSGGYDFILSENGGMRIDPTTVVGVRYINGSYIGVNLTSRDGQQSVSLQSGGSVPYVNANGKHCQVSVMRIDGQSNTASFAVGCLAT